MNGTMRRSTNRLSTEMGKFPKNKKARKVDAGEREPLRDSVRSFSAQQLSQDTQTSGGRYYTYLFAGIVSLITFIPYFFSLSHEFVNWDDDQYVYQNSSIRSFSLAFVRWAFLQFYASNWHPLTWISHAIDYAVWGLNPLGHHLTNNILHAFNTFIVVLISGRLINVVTCASEESLHSGYSARRFGLIAATATGLLFGLHPVHVESVAWVAERKDLLCGLFFLLSIMAYLPFRETFNLLSNNPHQDNKISGSIYLNKYYILALGFFILALLSKPMAVSLPGVLLLLDWYPFKRINSWKTFYRAIAEKVPFIGLSLASTILTVLAQKTAGAVVSFEDIPLPIRILTAAKSLMAYLWMMVAPVNLIPYYPYPESASLLSMEYLPAILLGIGISAGSIIIARKHKLWVSVWGYYVMTLFPVLGLVQVGSQAMADRYTYLPSLGPFLVVGLASARLSGWLDVSGHFFKRNLLFAGAAFGLIASLTYGTILQLAIWKDSGTLWRSVIEREPKQARMAYFNLGEYYRTTGQYGNAIDIYSKVLALKPTAYAFYNRGLAYYKEGKYDKAIDDYYAAIARYPSFGDAYFNLGLTYNVIGQLDKAVESFDRSIFINPTDFRAYHNRGLVYFKLNQFDHALHDYNKSIELNNSIGLAFVNRGKLHIAMDNRKLAISDFSRACALGDSNGCDLAKFYGFTGLP